MDKKTEKAFAILKLKVDEIGFVKTADALNYKDTEALKKWIYREKMPIAAVGLILHLWDTSEDS